MGFRCEKLRSRRGIGGVSLDGTRMVNGQVTIHQREVAVIEQIRTLRTQGNSYWKVADILNVMQIPTKSRRAKWQATTVLKILKKVDYT